MIKSQITNNPEETQKIATELAQQILRRKPGEQAVVLALSGDLGAGKTTFLQGFARGLGIEEVVNSPTFVIMKRFGNFYHIDCYRLEKPEEILEVGFKEIIKDPKNIVAIEWSEKIEKLLPKEIIKINFIHSSSTERELQIGA